MALCIHTGFYDDARNYVQSTFDATLSIPGTLYLTNSDWIKLGRDYVGLYANSQSTAKIIHVFCNNENFILGVKLGCLAGGESGDAAKVAITTHDCFKKPIHFGMAQLITR